MNASEFQQDSSIEDGPVVCHEKTMRGSRCAVAFTGRSLRPGNLPGLGKVIERWRRKVTGLRVHHHVCLWQPDRQTGVRFGSFVASFACPMECP
jgi:hypothetical protein